MGTQPVNNYVSISFHPRNFLIGREVMTMAFQFFAALLVGVCYYLIAMASTVYDGILSLIFQPFVGTIVTGLGIGLVSIVGLPIRCSPRLRSWWIEHWWISFVLGGIGFAMMWASFHPMLHDQVWDPDSESRQKSFNGLLGIGGWLATIFSVLHFFPPLKCFRANEEPLHVEHVGEDDPLPARSGSKVDRSIKP